jgi:hypothetical protein
LCSGIGHFKKGLQPRTNTEKDEKSDLVTDYRCTVTSFRKHVSQILNVQGVSAGWQAGEHTAETPVPDPSTLRLLEWPLKS